MVKHLIKKHLKVKSIVFSIVCLLNLSFNAQLGLAAEAAKLSAQATEGEKLFKANCTSCHAMDIKQVGPALQGVHTRRSEEWLVKWIRNNEKLRASGDKDAIAVFNENNKVAMNLFFLI